MSGDVSGGLVLHDHDCQPGARHATRTPCATSRTWQTSLSLLSITGATLAALLFLTLAVGPHLLGYRTMTMLTASMRPAIAPGDLLVVVPVPAGQVRVGDVLAFQPGPGAPVITHRVTNLNHTSAGTIARTRGDANQHQDSWRVQLDRAEPRRVRLVLPHLGGILARLRHPWVKALTVWVLPPVVCLEVLRAIWSRPRQTRHLP